MVGDWTELAVNMVKGEKARLVEQRAQELAEERLLDLLLPSPVRPMPAFPEAEAPLTTASETREKLRKLLHDGKLDDRIVELEVRDRVLPMI